MLAYVNLASVMQLRPPSRISASMEMRRAWMDQISQRSRDDNLAIDVWIRESLSQIYGEVLREELPKELLALLTR